MLQVIGLSFMVIGAFGAGVTATIYYGVYLLKKSEDKRQAGLNELRAKATEAETAINTVKVKLKKISELTEQQLDLAANVNRPSASALHSRHKNGLNGQIKELEEQKLVLFKSILNDDKFDPTITIMTADNQKESMKLSAYLERNGIDYKEAVPEAPMPEGAKRRGKFLVYDNTSED